MTSCLSRRARHSHSEHHYVDSHWPLPYIKRLTVRRTDNICAAVNGRTLMELDGNRTACDMDKVTVPILRLLSDNGNDDGWTEEDSCRLAKLTLAQTSDLTKSDMSKGLQTVTSDSYRGLEEMRPRSRTTSLVEPLHLPEIRVEDFSESKNAASESTDRAFTVFASPPRRRAFTCPGELFRRRPPPRPPTPPPFLSKTTNQKGKKKFTFNRKRLGQVSEDKSETALKKDTKSTPMSCKFVSTRPGCYEKWKGIPGGFGAVSREQCGMSNRRANGYVFTSERCTYIGLSSCGRDHREVRRDCPTGLRGPSTVSDNNPVVDRACRRSIGTEFKS